MWHWPAQHDTLAHVFADTDHKSPCAAYRLLLHVCKTKAAISRVVYSSLVCACACACACVRMCVYVCLNWLQIHDLQPKIDQAIKTGSPLVIKLDAKVYNMSAPLSIDLYKSQYANIPVTITGKGPDKTILDCYGAARALYVLWAGSVTVSDLTIRNCDLTKAPFNPRTGPPPEDGKHPDAQIIHYWRQI